MALRHDAIINELNFKIDKLIKHIYLHSNRKKGWKVGWKTCSLNLRI